MGHNITSHINLAYIKNLRVRGRWILST